VAVNALSFTLSEGDSFPLIGQLFTVVTAIKDVLDDVESTNSYITELKQAVDQITPILTRFSGQEVLSPRSYLRYQERVRGPP